MRTGRCLGLAAIIAITAGAANAGDAAEGEKNFKKCSACHAIVADDGTVIVKGGKAGPNLYGVVGRTIGSVEGFRYGDSLEDVGETGRTWDEDSLAAYVTDPKAWLAEALDDPKAKTKMSFKLKSGGEDIAAFLATTGG